MNRKLAVAAAALAVTALMGCDHEDADKPSDGKTSLMPTAPATGSRDKDEPEEPTEVKMAPPVIHPNVLVDVQCPDKGQIEVSVVNIDGQTDKQYLPVRITTVTPAASTGRDCSFRLTPVSGSNRYVLAIPRKFEGRTMWALTQALSAEDLTDFSSQKVAPGMRKGQSYRVYAEINGLPKPDSFNSAQNQTGSLNAQKKDYNRRAGEMNELMLNKLMAIRYPRYEDVM